MSEQFLTNSLPMQISSSKFYAVKLLYFCLFQVDLILLSLNDEIVVLSFSAQKWSVDG